MNFKIISLVRITHDLDIIIQAHFLVGLITCDRSRASLYAETADLFEINRKFAYLRSLCSITENFVCKWLLSDYIVSDKLSNYFNAIYIRPHLHSDMKFITVLNLFINP